MGQDINGLTVFCYIYNLRNFGGVTDQLNMNDCIQPDLNEEIQFISMYENPKFNRIEVVLT